MYNARMLFADAEKAGVEKDLPEKVWNAIGVYADECLRMGKGVKIPNLGSFSISNQTTSSTGKRRVFVVSGKFARSYGVPLKKVGYDMLAPCLEFNASRVAYKCNSEKDSVLHALHSIVRVLGAAVASGQACRIMFNPLGSILSQRRDVTFKFNSVGLQTSNSLLRQSSGNVNNQKSDNNGMSQPLSLFEESRRQQSYANQEAQQGVAEEEEHVGYRSTKMPGFDSRNRQNQSTTQNSFLNSTGGMGDPSSSFNQTQTNFDPSASSTKMQMSVNINQS
jgi:hypothetical protein